MKLLGVEIDFNKSYTPEELEQLEAELDARFRKLVGYMLAGMLVLISLAVLAKYIWQLTHG